MINMTKHGWDVQINNLRPYKLCLFGYIVCIKVSLWCNLNERTSFGDPGLN